MGSNILSGGVANFAANAIGKSPIYIGSPLTECYFGVGASYDGNNGNRAAGGNALAVIGSAPTYGSNFVAVGAGSGIDSQNPRTMILPSGATLFATGWTWIAVVALASATAPPADIIGDENTTSSVGFNHKITAQQADSTNGGNPSIRLYENATAAALITPTVSLMQPHFIAGTYTGGTGGQWLLYDFTTATPGTPLVSAPFTAASTIAAEPYFSPHIGSDSAETSVGIANVSYFRVDAGPLSQATLQTLYNNRAPLLKAIRGISC